MISLPDGCTMVVPITSEMQTRTGQDVKVGQHDLFYEEFDGESYVAIKFRNVPRDYTPRHENNGNCHHWWPETGFWPSPHINPCDGGDETGRCSHPACHGTPFRMLKREKWEVRSPKGFKPGDIVIFANPEYEGINGWGRAHVESFELLSRNDFSGTTRETANVSDIVHWGPRVAWRVKRLGADGSEWRFPESRLKAAPTLEDYYKVGSAFGITGYSQFGEGGYAQFEKTRYNDK